MAKKYHVILVAYDGFNPNEPDTEFQSVAEKLYFEEVAAATEK